MGHLMDNRQRDLRAAVARRQRSQDQLRTATVTVGLAGVVTAGAVAFILPGSTHAAASARIPAAPTPTPTTSNGSATTATTGSSATGSTPSSAPAAAKHHARKGSSPAGSSAATSPAPAPPVASVAAPHTVSGGSS
jgi:hypothetical protein